MEISVVLATFNEEKNLGDCLESVRGLADEIIVVDGGSTDKTVAIAKQYGAKVIMTDNPPIFHLNKQKAIEAATKDWILQLDADERVTLELKSEIEQALYCYSGIANAPQNGNINGYWLARKNWFLCRFLMKGGQYPDYTLRLYKRGKGKLPCKSVHEQAVVDGETAYLKNPLIHLADADFSRYLKRYDRYTDLMAQELKEGERDFWQPVKFLFFNPWSWFLLTYFRHKGFMDSWQGFVFSFFSALRFPVAYLKYFRKKLK